MSNLNADKKTDIALVTMGTAAVVALAALSAGRRRGVKPDLADTTEAVESVAATVPEPGPVSVPGADEVWQQAVARARYEALDPLRIFILFLGLVMAVLGAVLGCELVYTMLTGRVHLWR